MSGGSGSGGGGSSGSTVSGSSNGGSSNGGGSSSTGGPPPLSVVQGAIAYRPFSVALVDTTITLGGITPGTLGGNAIHLFVLSPQLAGFVVPEMAAGAHALDIPALGVQRTVLVTAPLDDGLATLVAQSTRAAMRQELEILRGSVDPEVQDLQQVVVDALARLDQAEADAAGLPAGDVRVMAHLVANLALDLPIPPTPEYDACVAEFNLGFRPKARLVLAALALVLVGEAVATGAVAIGIATGGVTLLLGAVVGGVAVAFTLSAAADTVRSGRALIVKCFEASVNAVAPQGQTPPRPPAPVLLNQFPDGIPRLFSFHVQRTLLLDAFGQLLGRVQSASNGLGLTAMWLSTLLSLPTGDHSMANPDPASVVVDGVTPAGVLVTAAPAGVGMITVTATATVTQTMDVPFGFRLRYGTAPGAVEYAGVLAPGMLDAGILDAGTDGGIDAGPEDAGTDAGPACDVACACAAFTQTTTGDGGLPWAGTYFHYVSMGEYELVADVKPGYDIQLSHTHPGLTNTFSDLVGTSDDYLNFQRSGATWHLTMQPNRHHYFSPASIKLRLLQQQNGQWVNAGCDTFMTHDGPPREQLPPAAARLESGYFYSPNLCGFDGTWRAYAEGFLVISGSTIELHDCAPGNTSTSCPVGSPILRPLAVAGPSAENNFISTRLDGNVRLGSSSDRDLMLIEARACTNLRVAFTSSNGTGGANILYFVKITP